MLCSKGWLEVKRKIKNTTKPKRTVSVDEEDYKKLSNVIYLDFTQYPKWTSCVSVDGFTNYLKDDNEALRHFYFIITELFRSVEDYDINKVFSGSVKGCHRLSGDHAQLALEVIREIHGPNILDEKSDIWEISNGIQEIRIIGVFVTSTMHYFYPLFIDHHHLIYPSKKYNDNDFKHYKFTTETIL
ncbi:hypothetical protein L2520_06580 [Limosilactobacillus vaginalis]|uniref:Uncharacterized protein n=1 Tax=Limosilactobacillus vaginalis TaxID=1633 RepID=A0ABT4K7V5_9LACO|nr:hypothetical protein [Limosilactobacillus vaginalis]MCZ3747078.1 hypothetical protein [Limosilactobacillus vaginalis]MCZ3752060.1 hypothetical protein [Limosilactobacillus vaginalis]MCZ3753734.1 hypothetical protein [Limosilactobacillus vaginalis]MCZ3755486.1 hypothetical protein [Limosilactobacillus vaginalis]MCZ3757170.1 hypothetical protein [Limosilactobacillus vaginalis]